MMTLGAAMVELAERLARFTERRVNVASWFGERWSVVVDVHLARALVGLEVHATLTEQPGEVDIVVRVSPLPFVVVHVHRPSSYSAWLGTCAADCRCCSCCCVVPCPGVCAGGVCDETRCWREAVEGLAEGGNDDDASEDQTVAT